MGTIGWVALVAVGAAVLWQMFGGGIDEKRAVEIRTLLGNGAVLIDVRTRSEFDDGHLEGAKNIPLNALRERLGALDRRKPIVVYCRSGSRSRTAVSILRQAGFESVADLGSYRNWGAVEAAIAPQPHSG